MSTPVYLLIVLLVAVAFIVLATSRFKWHPFIVLLMASYGIGFGASMDPLEIGSTIREGFGGILGYIGLVILLGTLISAFPLIAGYLWAQFAGRHWTSDEDGEHFDHSPRSPPTTGSRTD